MLINKELREAIEQEQNLRKVAYNLCENDAERIIKNKVTDENQIDNVIDQLLNFVTDEKFCELHRKLSDYVETFDSELAESYRRGLDTFLDYYYEMDGMHYTRCNIFCPNRNGQECIVCQPIDCRGILCTELDEQIKKLFPNWLFFFENKLKRMAKTEEWLGETYFHSVKTNGYDYNIATMFIKEIGDDNIAHINLEALRKSLKQVCVVATPLPARTLTKVRIPYKMGCEMTCDEWESVQEVIIDELAGRNIPVEIWQK